MEPAGRARPFLVIGIVGAFVLMAVAIAVAIGTAGAPPPDATPATSFLRGAWWPA